MRRMLPRPRVASDRQRRQNPASSDPDDSPHTTPYSPAAATPTTTGVLRRRLPPRGFPSSRRERPYLSYLPEGSLRRLLRGDLVGV